MVKFIDDFSQGLAPVIVYTPLHGLLYGFYNKKFEFAIDPVYYRAEKFSEGLAAVKSRDWGFINRQGKQKIDFQFYDVGSFSQGLCFAKVNSNGHYGYINKKGIFVIPPIYQMAWGFNCGLAIVVIDNGFYVINKKGRIISEKIANYTML